MLDLLLGGMPSIIGSVIGLATSTLPRLFGLWEAKQRDAHELKVMEANRIAAKDQAELRVQEASLRAASTHNAAVYSTVKATGTWTDSYRATVRPTITYFFFMLFCAVKVSHLLVVMNAGVAAPQAILSVWDPSTQGLFATIISFWFGSRIMRQGK